MVDSSTGTGRNLRALPAESGLASAEWEFSNLIEGRYQLATTWRPGTDNASRTAPFGVWLDGQLLFSSTVDQSLPPAGFEQDGRWWACFDQIVGIEAGRTLSVRLTNETDRAVLAEAIRLERMGSRDAYIIEDGDAGFATTGTWTLQRNQAASGGSTLFSFPGEGPSTAQWTFSRLPPGNYRVAATWYPNSYHAVHAPFTVAVGHHAASTVSVNQRTLPGDVTLSGRGWTYLGDILAVFPGEDVRVTLSNSADSYVWADAVRIEWQGPLSTEPKLQVTADEQLLRSGDSVIFSPSDSSMTFVGQSVTKVFHLRNIGLTSVTLPDQIELPPGYSLLSWFDNGQLLPNESASFTVRLDSDQVGTFEGSLVLLAQGQPLLDARLVGTVLPTVDSMITVRTQEQAEALRSRLIERIWGEAGVSAALAVTTAIEENVPNPLPGIAHVQRVDRLTISMGDGCVSYVYFFHPVNATGQLTLFHQGHSNDLGSAACAQTIEQLLLRGHSVMALYMPTFGPNTAPVSYQTLQQNMTIQDLRYFLDPILIALRHAELQHMYRPQVNIIGVSGGLG